MVMLLGVPQVLYVVFGRGTGDGLTIGFDLYECCEHPLVTWTVTTIGESPSPPKKLEQILLKVYANLIYSQFFIF